MVQAAMVKFVLRAAGEAWEVGYAAGDASAEEVWAAINAEGNASREAVSTAGYAAGCASVERADNPRNEAQDLLRAPLGVLLEAVVAVGDVFGTNARCVEAAALLQETARLLGYQLRVRPVSLFARHVRTETWAVMGPRATGQLSHEARANAENYRPGGKDTGHLVLTSEEPCLLFDPNLRQLGASGYDAPSLILRINSTNPDTGRWLADAGSWQLEYILDEDNRVLIDWLDEIVRRLSSDAEYLAGMLRSGATAQMMRAQRHTS